MNTRKTAGTAENPAANKYPPITLKFHALDTLHAFTIHRRVSRPVGLLFGHLDTFFLSLSIGPKFWTHHCHPYPRAISLKIESFLAWVRGKAPVNFEIDWSNSF